MKEAISTIERYNPELYDMYDISKIDKIISDYDNSINSTLSIYDHECSHIKGMDSVSSLYIRDHISCLEEFPILKTAYNTDGSKKDIIQLIMDRREKIKQNLDIEKLNSLYDALCNDKNFVAGGLKGTKNEIELLVSYLHENDFDEFELSLLVLRLNKTNLTNEQKNRILQYVKEKEFVCKNDDLKSQKT